MPNLQVVRERRKRSQNIKNEQEVSELYESINSNDSDSTDSIDVDSSDSLSLIRQGLIDAKNDKDTSLYNAYMQTLIQRGFDLEARDYNSVISQVERLMAAGMSRTQALLTATAGDATPTMSADLATASANDETRKQQAVQFAVSTAFNAVGGLASFAVGNYGALFKVAGDSLVSPVAEEVYSWLPRGIHVPDEARASAESFKNWMLGNLKDSDGNTIEPPKEAKELIRSKEWSRMASSLAGQEAFRQNFNANFSTRGYKETEQDAARIRRLQTLSVINARMQQFMNLPALYDTTLDLAMSDLQGISVDVSENGVSGILTSPDKGWLMFDDSGTSRTIESETTPTASYRYFINDDGTLRDDAPAQLRLLVESLAHDLSVIGMMNNPDYLRQAEHNLVSNEELKSIMLEADKIIQSYRRDQLTNASATKSNNEFINLLQNVLTNYMLMTGGRSFIDDAGSFVGFGTDTYLRKKRLGHHFVDTN